MQPGPVTSSPHCCLSSSGSWVPSTRIPWLPVTTWPTGTGEAGDAAGARDQLAALFPVRERVLGPEHPYTLATRHNLADWTGEAGDAAWARDQLAALLPIVERILGPEHPHTLAARGNLADWTRRATRAAQAGDRLDVGEYYDFFISYSGPDRAWAEALAQGLQSRGIEVFLDQWQIRQGDLLIEKLRAALSAAQAYIIVFGDAPERSWATAEREAVLAQAITNRRDIIPVRVGTAAIPPEFRDRQYVDLRPDQSNIDQAVEAIANLTARLSASRRRIHEDLKQSLPARSSELRDNRPLTAATSELMLKEARATGNRTKEALAQYSLGITAQERGDYEQANDFYYQALATFQEIGDRRATAAALHQLGITAQERGDYEQANDFYYQALATFQEIGDRRATAAALHQLGITAQERGDYEQANDFYYQALATFQEIGDRRATAAALHQLGITAQERGDYEQANDFYYQALATFQEIGDRRATAAALHQLGIIAQERGDFEQANEFYYQALATFQEIGDRRATAAALHQLGIIAQERGDFEQANEFYYQALATFQEIGDRRATAAALHQLGIIAQERGDFKQADDLLELARRIRAEFGDRLGVASSLSQLGALRTVEGRPAEGVPLNAASHNIRRKLGSPDYVVDLQWLGRQRELLGDAEFERLLGDAIRSSSNDDTPFVASDGITRDDAG